MTDEPHRHESTPDEHGRNRVRKSAEAYRTISEVADELHVPQHVLRFWETKFPRIKPLKRGGGRRYYRPDDVLLLQRIADLLYIQGYTIKGVQRLLRESGGLLHDEIPPASEEERAASAAERARADIPAPPAPRPDRLPELPIDPAPATSNPGHAPAAMPGADSAPLERARAATALLRAAMVSVLAELEDLRASLDK
ncbi:MerR family transcriptional regulator [Acidiphilium sp.]|uniref:MerR family transcriptional regulator n=1 Tax=Acidiphilium sp. TaxID=527 RepID=UPI003D045E38